MEQNSFLFQAIVFLASAVLFVPLAKRLGLGSVLGYLIAGIIIGPFVFGLVGEEGQDIMHFAEFGVVMMLFLIGLELEPKLLWRLRKSIIGLGSLQVMVTAGIIGIGTDIFFILHCYGNAIAPGKRINENRCRTKRIFGFAFPGHCRHSHVGYFSFACYIKYSKEY
jgi:Kef-type K+ transport system membrane component KefB